jgi:hypothetical protein
MARMNGIGSGGLLNDEADEIEQPHRPAEAGVGGFGQFSVGGGEFFCFGRTRKDTECHGNEWLWRRPENIPMMPPAWGCGPLTAGLPGA